MKFPNLPAASTVICFNAVGRGGNGGYGGTRWPIGNAPDGASGAGGWGGGVGNSGVSTIENSTIVGNRSGQGGYLPSGQLGGSGGSGGGLAAENFSSLTLRHCTIASNTPGIGATDGRGGIVASASFTLVDVANTVIARNPSAELGERRRRRAAGLNWNDSLRRLGTASIGSFEALVSPVGENEGAGAENVGSRRRAAKELMNGRQWRRSDRRTGRRMAFGWNEGTGTFHFRPAASSASRAVPLLFPHSRTPHTP